MGLEPVFISQILHHVIRKIKHDRSKKCIRKRFTNLLNACWLTQTLHQRYTSGGLLAWGNPLHLGESPKNTKKVSATTAPHSMTQQIIVGYLPLLGITPFGYPLRNYPLLISACDARWCFILALWR
jgi:hypothetical protein